MMFDCNNKSESLARENPDAERYSLTAFAKMNAFRKRAQLCDVVVKVGGREFPAHRVVLAASSDYFDAMFSSGMAESAQLEVELKSVSPDVMEALLDFVYTGQVRVSMENVQDLLPAASLVQMEGVKTVCSDFLFGEVDASNVLGIRRFAELHNCNELESFAKNYAAHNFETVVEFEEFLFLSSEELIESLNREDLHVESEETAYNAVIRWVYHDVNERAGQLPGLLEHLRLATMSVRFLTDSVDNERLIRQSLECRDLVDEAKRFHLRPDLRFQMRNRRFHQRDGGYEYLVVIGGFGAYQSPTNSVEMFNPRTREWSDLPNLSISYRYVAACSLGTCVYVIGGFDGGERLNTVGLLDVAQREDGWRWLTPMHYKRGLSAACTHKGLIYVCGGFDGQTRLRALEVYHPKIDEWRVLEEMNTAREGAGLVVADDCLYCLGGYDGFQLLNSMEAFDLSRGAWSLCKPMYMRRSGAGCAVLGDTIYVCGGYGGGEGRGPLHLDTVEAYNTRLSQWTLVSNMNVPRCYVGACQLAGRIYVAAGYNGNRLLNTVEAFDPVENIWTLYEENRMHNERCDTGMCVVRFLSCAEPPTPTPSTSGSSVVTASGDLGTLRNQSDVTIPNLRSLLTTTSPRDSASTQQQPPTPLISSDNATGRLSGPMFRASDQTTQVQVVTPLFQGGGDSASGGPGGAFARPSNSHFNQSSSSSARRHISESAGTMSLARTGVGARITCGLMFNNRTEDSGTVTPRIQPVSSASYHHVPISNVELNRDDIMITTSIGTESVSFSHHLHYRQSVAPLLHQDETLTSLHGEVAGMSNGATPLPGTCPESSGCRGEVFLEDGEIEEEEEVEDEYEDEDEIREIAVNPTAGLDDSVLFGGLVDDQTRLLHDNIHLNSSIYLPPFSIAHMPTLFPSIHSVNDSEVDDETIEDAHYHRPISDAGVGQDEVEEDDEEEISIAMPQEFSSEDLLGGIFLDTCSDDEKEDLTAVGQERSVEMLWSDSEAARLAYLRLDEAGEEEGGDDDRLHTWGFVSARAQSLSPDDRGLMLLQQRPRTTEPDEMISSDENRILPTYYSISDAGPPQEDDCLNVSSSNIPGEEHQGALTGASPPWTTETDHRHQLSTGRSDSEAEESSDHASLRLINRRPISPSVTQPLIPLPILPHLADSRSDGEGEEEVENPVGGAPLTPPRSPPNGLQHPPDEG